jgi:pimeloyl-ACP methyl ester carboxylesterase
MSARSRVVFVPGLLCDARLWRAQAEALAGAAECWIADATRADTMVGLAADLLADCPFERFALAGLSMGGYVALEVMRQAPGRIERLALLDTTARPDTPEQSQKRRDFIALAGRGRFLGITDALLPMLVHPSRLDDAELVALVKAMAREIGKEAFVRQERAIMSRADSRPLLPAIACPTLVLCGRQDALTPLDRHEEIAAAVPGARLRIVEDCGHLSTLERPGAVNAALERWLAAHSPA